MILKNANYIDVINGKVVTSVDIEIEDGKIVNIGQNLNGNDYIDCSSKLIVPAFTNAHTHMGMSMMRNYSDDLELQDWLEQKIWPFEAKLTKEDMYWGSKLSAIESVKNGVCAVVDMYDNVDATAKVCNEVGIKGILGKGLLDIDGRGADRLEAFKQNYNECNSEKTKVILAPHAIYTCSTEFLKECLMLSREYGNVLHIHVSETKREFDDCVNLHGMTPVEYLETIGYLDTKIIAAHCVYLTDKEIDMIADKEFYPVYNPVSNLKLASGFTPVKKILDAKINLGIGTDSSSSNNSLSVLKEIQVGAIVNKAINKSSSSVQANEILKLATINGSKITGFNNGAVEVGKEADLTFFDLNSINFTPKNDLIGAVCYSASSEDIRDVMIDGKFVMKDRVVLTADEEQIKYEVNRLTDRILRS
ncbi:5-methylthioadenosine/S-adenosylhomocysteine deaminase [Peptoniphilus asaccharolyticus DSM 20463]|uniref:5-methylthioadenosine/S-adenosylhomocysteine deaminase n=1 Tax=Peptoniphilus asaccharolyticus DSM 20463 TaxID=573058 RepID=A0A1W1VAM9_PEPAS|nr:amidohydrolase [Peptoniphilus asaccharolyticus]MBL7575720.1 amidohydrolase [Peptoniphilus asaccharolyticus]SMB90336.1 5-methylthioadenosine/S-adenosylhomocysteine deaminase [Peptoniphilus asaccharolyticus DSM 20463]